MIRRGRRESTKLAVAHEVTRVGIGGPTLPSRSAARPPAAPVSGLRAVWSAPNVDPCSASYAAGFTNLVKVVLLLGRLSAEGAVGGTGCAWRKNKAPNRWGLCDLSEPALRVAFRLRRLSLMRSCDGESSCRVRRDQYRAEQGNRAQERRRYRLEYRYRRTSYT